VSTQCDKYYIGSTYLSIDNRLKKHNDSYKSYLNGKYHFVSSFDILQYDDHKIELIELFPCTSKVELETREGIIQRQHNNNIVNYRIAGRTKSQYITDTKAQKKAYDIEHRKTFPKVTCICGSLYNSRHKTDHEKTKKHISFLKLGEIFT
jgi:hypothetical protein